MYLFLIFHVTPTFSVLMFHVLFIIKQVKHHIQEVIRQRKLELDQMKLKLQHLKVHLFSCLNKSVNCYQIYSNLLDQRAAADQNELCKACKNHFVHLTGVTSTLVCFCSLTLRRRPWESDGCCRTQRTTPSSRASCPISSRPAPCSSAYAGTKQHKQILAQFQLWDLDLHQLSFVSRMETEVELLERQESVISDNESLILNRLKAVEKSPEDIIKVISPRQHARRFVLQLFWHWFVSVFQEAQYGFFFGKRWSHVSLQNQKWIHSNSFCFLSHRAVTGQHVHPKSPRTLQSISQWTLWTQCTKQRWKHVCLQRCGVDYLIS